MFYRINGELHKVNDTVVSAAEIQAMLVELLTDRHKKELQEKRQTDFGVISPGNIRLRGNAFFQDNGISVSFRVIPAQLRDFSTLGFPDFVQKKLLEMQNGFVLVVGPTGQGKSTTLAAVLQERLKHRPAHVLTVEDPIEYKLVAENSVIQQREVGRDVPNFQAGIRAGLREDPDVLMVGEMRDHETISAALTMAETGHVVFSTLHTNNGAQTVSRIIDVFPGEQQDQIRSQLASTLSMVISQRLVPTADGKDRVLAFEVLTSNYAVQNYIRQNKIFQIPNVLQTDSTGQQIEFEQSLAGLVMTNRITQKVAFENALDKEQLKSLLMANRVQVEPAFANA